MSKPGIKFSSTFGAFDVSAHNLSNGQLIRGSSRLAATASLTQHGRRKKKKRSGKTNTFWNGLSSSLIVTFLFSSLKLLFLRHGVVADVVVLDPAEVVVVDERRRRRHRHRQRHVGQVSQGLQHHEVGPRRRAFEPDPGKLSRHE